MSRLTVDTILRTALAASDNGRSYRPASTFRISTPYIVRTMLSSQATLLGTSVAEEYRRIELASEEVDHNLIDEIIRYIITLNGRSEFITRLREVVRVDEPTDEDIGLVTAAVSIWARAHPERVQDTAHLGNERWTA